MAERTMVVCDVCGDPAAETVTIRVSGRSVLKDLCSSHLSELLNGTRASTRGRRPKRGAASPVAVPARRPVRSVRSAPKQAAAPIAKRRRGPITDPLVLQKRRDALAKARKVLADRRAAAAANP